MPGGTQNRSERIDAPDAMAFADLLREPLAASRALLELLASSECPDPGMIGGYLHPALRELSRACELLEDLRVLADAGHAAGRSDEREPIDLHQLITSAGLDTFRRGEMLPPLEVDATAAAGWPLVIRGHRPTVDRMLRTAVEFTAETTMPDAGQAVPVRVHATEDPRLGPMVQLAFGRVAAGNLPAGDAAAATDRHQDDDGLGTGEADGMHPGARPEAHRFRQRVLEAMARGHGGTAIFGDAAAPAAMCISLPCGRREASRGPGERAA